MLTETNNLHENTNKKLSRFLVYLISIGVFIVSSLLLLFILPYIIFISDLLDYAIVIIFSIMFGLLFKYLLDKSECKNIDYILLSVVISTLTTLVFGFLKYMELMFNAMKNNDMISLGAPNSYPSLVNFPNVDLLFLLFMVLFNISFIYKYLQNFSDKKYMFLYIIPIICYFLISFAVNTLFGSSISMGLVPI